MSNNQEDALSLAWAAQKIRKAQDDKAYCTIVVHIKEGQIIKAERNESFIPPSPGVLFKQSGS
jgi:hypothetical protein